MSKPKLISVIIPAYQQASTIVKDLTRIQAVLKQIRYPSEIIVVVDGRLDQTYQRAKTLASSHLHSHLKRTTLIVN